MPNHPYIRLSTTTGLGDDAVKLWFGAVSDAGPEGCIASTELRADRTPVRFYMRESKGQQIYTVVLSRNLTNEEATKIAEAYAQTVPNGDFEITYSQQFQQDTKPKQISTNLIKAIALEAAKKNHGSWLRQKTNEGWRFGQKHSPKQKMSPVLQDWENLSEQYQRHEYQRMLSLMEVLEGMNLSLVRRIP
jgi:hypothetical protein